MNNSNIIIRDDIINKACDKAGEKTINQDINQEKIRELENLREIILNVCNYVYEKYNLRDAFASVLITDDEEIKMLNSTWRKIHETTDVLSFEFCEGLVRGGYLGDIAISIDQAKKQSLEYGHSLSREIAFLVSHGLLHLLGMDHIEEEEEKIMMEEQKLILNELGYLRTNNE